jgi:hypothetical protein
VLHSTSRISRCPGWWWCSSEVVTGTRRTVLGRVIRYISCVYTSLVYVCWCMARRYIMWSLVAVKLVLYYDWVLSLSIWSITGNWSQSMLDHFNSEVVHSHLNTGHYSLGMFPSKSNQCRCLTKIATQHGHVVGLKLRGLQKTYCTNPRHLYMTWFLPHTVHLIYEEYLLVSSFHHEFDTVMFYIKSDKFWYHSVLAIMHRSRADCHLPGSEYNVATKCP